MVIKQVSVFVENRPGLARRGQKVLIVDPDGQALQTVSLGWRQPDKLPVIIAM